MKWDKAYHAPKLRVENLFIQRSVRKNKSFQENDGNSNLIMKQLSITWFSFSPQSIHEWFAGPQDCPSLGKSRAETSWN
jgi:hypothetical protein